MGARYGGGCLPIIQRVKAGSSYIGNSRSNSDTQASKQAREREGKREERRGDRERQRISDA